MKTSVNGKPGARATAVAKKKRPTKDIAASYNKYKLHNGKQYTGMQIGRSHSWYYDRGEWKEKKVTPEKWEINYSVTKRRKGKAPEGLGVPVGTAYHWFIVADQYVTKLNANDYTTSMTGLKLKIAHKRASSDKWSLTEKSQRKKLIRMLKEFITELEQAPVEVPLKPATKTQASKKTASQKGAKKKSARRKTLLRAA